MPLKLSWDTIRKRLEELRNLRMLHRSARTRVEELKEKCGALKARVRELAAENKDLKRRVAALERQLSDRDDTNARQRFFLFPQRKQEEAAHQRKKTRKKRHKASYSRPAPAEEEITSREEVTAEHCPSCSGSLSASQDTYTRHVEDIRFAPKTVTEYTVHRYYCRCCRNLVTPSIPGALPGMQIGMNTLLYVLLEIYGSRTPQETVRANLARYFGMEVSDGEITRLKETAARYFGDYYATLCDALAHAETVFSDETSWFIGDRRGWVWRIAAGDRAATRFVVTDTRGKGVIEEALGTDFTGTRVTDFYPAYKNLSGDHQVCWSHLVKDADLLVGAKQNSAERTYLADTLHRQYATLRGFKAKGRTPHRSTHTYRKVSCVLDELTDRRWRDPGCRKLVNRIREYREQLLTCVWKPGVPPDNNASERGLRPVVQHRDVSRGNRSSKGARTYAVNRSVIETVRRETAPTGVSLFDALKQILEQAAASARQRGGVGASTE